MSIRKSVKKEAPVEAAVKKEATVVEPVKGAEAAPQKGLRKRFRRPPLSRLSVFSSSSALWSGTPRI